jgi:stage II sporulation protein M
MKKENLSLDYKRLFNFIFISQNFIWFSLIIFLLFLIMGLIFPIFFKQEIILFLSNLKAIAEKLNLRELIFFIFKNNIKASFFVMFFGIFAGIFPIVMLAVNGYLIGFVLNYAVSSSGIFAVWKLFPHGIFELPAVLISAGLGLKIGLNLIRGIFTNSKTNFKQNLINSIKVFIFIVIPLLIIAAIIEGVLLFFIK